MEILIYEKGNKNSIITNKQTKRKQQQKHTHGTVPISIKYQFVVGYVASTLQVVFQQHLIYFRY